MNEPRLKGHANEWWFDANSKDCLRRRTVDQPPRNQAL